MGGGGDGGGKDGGGGRGGSAKLIPMLVVTVYVPVPVL